jgi:hypothetical protein
MGIHKIDFLALKRLSVFDEKGRTVPLNYFWKDKPIVMIFIRHFGCIACRAHVDMIWNKRQEFKNKKTNIVFIGNGKPEAIRMFKEDIKALDAPVFTDPSLEVFDACGMKRGIVNLIDPRSVGKFISLSKKGYSQGTINETTGAHTQMGGVVAFKPPGTVVYHFVSNYLGDFDRPEDWPVFESEE